MKRTKTPVEACCILDVFEFARRGYLAPGASGSRMWEQKGKVVTHLLWERRDEGADEYLALDLPEHRGGENLHHPMVELSYTPGTFGGRRVWFVCIGCGTEVRKLYLPPDQIYFSCGRCHSLSYRSRQTRPRETLSKDEQWERFELAALAWEPRAEKVRRRRQAARGVKRATAEALAMASAPAPETSAPHTEPDPELKPAPPPPPKRPPGRPRTKRPYRRHQPLEHGERAHDQQAYCVRCRDFRDLTGPHLVTLSNGRPALTGACSACGCRLARVVKGATQPRGI